MLRTFPFLACCAVLVACGSVPPTAPTKIPSLTRTRFLAFGDSMTSGEVTAPVGVISGLPDHGIVNPTSTRMVVVPAASYPTQLLAMAQARYTTQAPALTITNAGKPGEYSFQAAPRFASTLAEVRPEVVLLLHGVNDLPFLNSDLPASSLRDMVIQGKNAGAMVFLATLMPYRPGGRNSPNAALFEELNAKIKAMAVEEGVVLVNLYDALLPEVTTVIGIDGLHPTEVGYRRIADVFFASIQANLEVK